MSNTETNEVLRQNHSPDKKQEKIPIIELKNGKVLCKQKCVSFEKQSETLQEIVRFREMLEERIENQEPPLTDVPEKHKPLIAKLAHESDKGLGALAKHIRQELLPAQDEDDGGKESKANASLPLAIVENAICSILIRNNYGLDAPSGVKALSSLSIWRWEVKQEHWAWLPKNGREKAEIRLADRVQAKQALNTMFDSLPQSERDAILEVKGGNKFPIKESNKSGLGTPGPLEKIVTGNDGAKTFPSSSEGQGKRMSDDVKSNTVSSFNTAKEKEKFEKKALKAEKAEKEKKEKDAYDKQKSIMANFFAKPKVSVSSRASKEIHSAIAGPSKVQSDFKKTFKPFVLKKDAALAPTNWFKESKKKKKHTSTFSGTELIIIDGDSDPNLQPEDAAMQDIQISENDLGNMSMQERLKDILSSLPPPAEPSRLRSRRGENLPRGYKIFYPTSIRDIMNQLSEAEIIGDDVAVRHLIAKLRDRHHFAAKAFVFCDDARPGYFGTWTRNSRIIGPRTPFARDVVVFDYGYDSGEEWEAEPAGDADDVAEDGDDDDDAEEVDSDIDSWLVDDDEEPEAALGDVDLINPPDIFHLGPLPTKRKAGDDGEKKLGKKRKVVVPLVPFVKGPYWEETVGQCSYEPFKAYRIQLFNDSPFPINPFTYVSTCVEDHRNSLKAVVPNATTTDGFAVPPLPPRLTAINNTSSPFSTNGVVPSTSLPLSPSAIVIPKKAPVLKTPFPDVHVPFLLEKITQLETGSFTLLVEFIYEALKINKVTKAAVEAKIREVGEKCKVKKKWTVKPALLATMAQIPTS